jgi:hypothetical protein
MASTVARRLSADLYNKIGTKQTSCDVRYLAANGGILLQKSFWSVERKFLEPLVRFARGDVRDHIG